MLYLLSPHHVDTTHNTCFMKFYEVHGRYSNNQLNSGTANFTSCNSMEGWISRTRLTKRKRDIHACCQSDAICLASFFSECSNFMFAASQCRTCLGIGQAVCAQHSQCLRGPAHEAQASHRCRHQRHLQGSPRSRVRLVVKSHLPARGATSAHCRFHRHSGRNPTRSEVTQSFDKQQAYIGALPKSYYNVAAMKNGSRARDGWISEVEDA